MNSSIKVDKNSKLYQKFLEAKGKKRGQQANQSNPERRTQGAKSKIQHNRMKNEDEIIKQESIQSLNRQVFDENSDYFNRKSFESDRKSVKIISKETIKSKQQKQQQCHQDESDKKEQHNNFEPIVEQLKQKTKEDQNIIRISELEVQNQSLKTKVNQLMKNCNFLTKQLQETKQALLYRQHEALKWREQYESLNDDISVAMRESIKTSKQFSAIRIPKESQTNMINQLKKEKQRLQTQNYMAKEYIYQITLKLYYSQQEKQKLKQQFGIVEDKLQNQSEVMNQVKAQFQSFQKRQRIEPKQKIINKAQDQQHQSNQMRKQSVQSTLNRIQQITIQLNEISQTNFQNGRLRRRKIDLQRQLQQLNKYLKHTLI